MITLGIVGVVSALVLPTFTTRMQTAKVGPRLAKAVAAFEQANIAILQDEQVDSLTAAEDLNVVNSQTADSYFNNGIKNHMKGSYDSSKIKLYAADGVTYCLVSTESNPPNIKDCKGKFKPLLNQFPHLAVLFPHERAALMIDIDGDNGPNAMGRDLFFFQMMDNGSLRPWGGSWEDENKRWTTRCPKNRKPIYSQYCAGHILENGLKVEYK